MAPAPRCSAGQPIPANCFAGTVKACRLPDEHRLDLETPLHFGAVVFRYIRLDPRREVRERRGHAPVLGRLVPDEAARRGAVGMLRLFIMRRTLQIGRGVLQQLVHGVPGCEVIVHALFLSALAGRKVDQPSHLAPLLSRKVLESAEGRVDLPLLHNIRVEDYIDLPAIQGHGLPLGERRLAAVLVRSAPVPHPNQRDGTQSPADQRIALLDSLRDEQRRRRDLSSRSPQNGCTSRAMPAPLGVSYLIGFPRLPIRGSSGRDW